MQSTNRQNKIYTTTTKKCMNIIQKKMVTGRNNSEKIKHHTQNR